MPLYLSPLLPLPLSIHLFPVPSHSLSGIYHIVSPHSPPPHPNPIVTFSHCPSVICKTAHLARYRERWEEMSHSSAKQRTITLECQLAKWCWRWREEVVAVVGGRLDEWAEEWRMTGAAPFYCAFFLKTWRFFNDYSNPTEDLSARTGCLICPPQSFSH